MSVVDHLLNLVNRLQNDLTLYANINLGRLSIDVKSIALRVMPSGNVNYYQGKRSREVMFQILAKSNDQIQAIKALEQIADKLVELDCEVYTEPSYLQQDEQGYTYTASFRTFI